MDGPDWLWQRRFPGGGGLREQPEFDYRQDRPVVATGSSRSFRRLSGLVQANSNYASGGGFPRGQDPQMLIIKRLYPLPGRAG